MKDRKLPLTYCATEEFLLDAFKDGAHLPLIRRAPNDPILRSSLYALTLYVTEPVSFKDVGFMLQPVVSYETARKRVRDSIGFLWAESSEDTRSRHPLEAIPYKKPPHEDSHRRGLSETTQNIMKAIEAGGGYEQVTAFAEVNGNVLASRRSFLKGKGVELPYKHFSPEQYASLINICSDPTIDRDEYVKLIPKITLATAQHLIRTTSAMLSLTSALEECGYFVKTRGLEPLKRVLLEEELILHLKKVIQSGPKEGEIQYYYFAARRDLDLIRSRLMSEVEFDRFRRLQSATG